MKICRPSALALFIGLFIALASLPAQAQSGAAEAAERRDARLKWWREAKFGLFIHWGLYSKLGGVYNGKTLNSGGEAIMNLARIPVAEYLKIAGTFNPTKFDAEAWADAAQAAGAKYLIVTAKYQDGFAMYPSRFSRFNLTEATPFKRDPLKELAAACKKRGLKFGLYYSQAQDWLNPGGAAYNNDNLWLGTGKHWDKAQDGDFDRYLRGVAFPQVKELLETYDPALLWFDTPMAMSKARTDAFAPLLARPNPNIIVNDRLGGSSSGFFGDFSTAERFVPASGPANRDWETRQSLNESWGYTGKDTKYKSATELLRSMVETVSKGGNFLLNTAPTGEGAFVPDELERLQQIGAWLKVNGEAIYAAQASPFKRRLRWGYCTQRPGKLYLHVYNWPKEGPLLVPIANPVTKAYLLARPQESLVYKSDPDGVRVTLPGAAPDASVSVIALEVPGAVEPLGLTQALDGTVTVLAEEAFAVGTQARLEHEPLNIGYWYNDDYLVYPVKIHAPGRFRVELNFAIDPGSDNNQFTVTAGGRPMKGRLTNSGSWGDYSTANFGELEIPKTGVVQIVIRPVNPKPNVGLMNLRSMTLTPARPIVGAIRWDGYYTVPPPKPGAKPAAPPDPDPLPGAAPDPALDPANAPPRAMERSLGPKQYQYRAPFFAKITGPNSIKIDGYTAATINAELGFARAGGIDYWAFVLAEEDSLMSQALRLYLSSLRRREVNFCAVAPAYTFGVAAEFPTKMQRLLTLMASPAYQTVLGDRPLLYLMDVSDEAIEAWGGVTKVRALFDGLRTAAREKSLGAPYIVVLDGDPAHGKRMLDIVGADAISAYATPGEGKNAPYAALAKNAAAFWEVGVATGAPVVPIAMTGWDRRPRVEHPVPWEPWQKPGAGLDEFYQMPTPAELSAHLREAMDWTVRKKTLSPARTVLTYAWNEHDEGGFLCPTLGANGKPDTQRLDAIGLMLKNYRVKEEIPARP